MDTQRKTCLHNLLIRSFLVEGPPMKLLEPSPRFSTIAPETNRFSTPYSVDLAH